MSDPFKRFQSGLESPATRVIEIQPHDDEDLALVSRALNVAEPGSVRVTTAAGDVASVFVAAGITFPIRVSRIWATGTTATGITVLC
ncbi:spike base protein, RCAP_Rcc01079 family [Roseitranquillus sediminis]|uniref:spike base protein, RCAP_Rcc01079 family n=1 Tax=Roseitranquillus sediminis TaxID=2809051 RepID=UPI001D0C3147|nr:hypothetical protein [Roseitranquillus sediminis]MBM9593928.1 hypothetical protein [Roseitranquillus sediminis]